MNTRLLRKVQKAIVAHAAHFRMTTWGDYGATLTDIIHNDPPGAVCDTTACIAGFAIVLKGEHINENTAAVRGRRLLGLSAEQASLLFYVGNWPARFRTRHNRAVRRQTEARIACERIEHFIKTKGEE